MVTEGGASGEPSEHRSGIIALPGNQDAAGASVPAPLAIVAEGATAPIPLPAIIKRAGMGYRQCYRENNVAVYFAKGPGNRVEYETIEIQLLAAGEFAGKLYPPREAFPSSAAWGRVGWTFTSNSHRDPLAAALAKARGLIGETERTREATMSKEEGA